MNKKTVKFLRRLFREMYGRRPNEMTPDTIGTVYGGKDEWRVFKQWWLGLSKPEQEKIRKSI